jgi:hypothetical protein
VSQSTRDAGCAWVCVHVRRGGWATGNRGGLQAVEAVARQHPGCRGAGRPGLGSPGDLGVLGLGVRRRQERLALAQGRALAWVGAEGAQRARSSARPRLSEGTARVGGRAADLPPPWANPVLMLHGSSASTPPPTTPAQRRWPTPQAGCAPAQAGAGGPRHCLLPACPPRPPGFSPLSRLSNLPIEAVAMPASRDAALICARTGRHDAGAVRHAAGRPRAGVLQTQACAAAAGVYLPRQRHTRTAPPPLTHSYSSCAASHTYGHHAWRHALPPRTGARANRSCSERYC